MIIFLFTLTVLTDQTRQNLKKGRKFRDFFDNNCEGRKFGFNFCKNNWFDPSFDV